MNLLKIEVFLKRTIKTRSDNDSAVEMQKDNHHHHHQSPSPREATINNMVSLITLTSSQAHEEERRWKQEKLIKLYTLGAEGVLPSRHIESFLRVFKQLTHNLPSRQVVGYLSMCPPL